MHTQQQGAIPFQDQFFSQTMHQIFNRKVGLFETDEDEAPIRKYLKAHRQL